MSGAPDENVDKISGITPEMIEAGVDCLYGCDMEDFTEEKMRHAVEKVFRVMVEVRSKSHPSA
jgi:hypothetical protein